MSIGLPPFITHSFIKCLLAICLATIGCSKAQELKYGVALHGLASLTSAPATEVGTSEEGDEGPSDADRIAELQDTVTRDQEQLAALEKEIDDPQSEYARAEQAFSELKDLVEAQAKQLEEARAAGNTASLERLAQEMASLERKHKLAEERFDLAIEDRRTLREQIQTLRAKLKQDRQALDELTGEMPPEEPTAAKEGNRKEEDREKEDSQSPSESDKKDDDDRKHESSKDADREEAHAEEPLDEEETEAAREVEARETAAEEAQQETQTLAARIASTQKLIIQEQKELSLARRKVELAEAAQFEFSAELQKRIAEKGTEPELAKLRAEGSDASRRLLAARAEVNAIMERLNERRAELGVLQSEHIVALHEAEEKRKEADAAEAHLQSLRNPFAWRNIQQWIEDHSLRLIAILLGMFVLNKAAGFLAYRSVRFVSSGTNRGSRIERENRAKTLVGVFQNAATVGIFLTGFLMILEEVGANVTVLMGGVAVIGLAVAFGAQNLIKDYFYGFVMLLENQYMLNDSIRIGSLSGQVERITLRMTVLRDSSGVVHFVPNGTIESVSNETHGWSRAVCEINVGYEEDLDQVLDVLQQVSETMARDPGVGPLMLESPSAPAIDAFGESSIQLKVAVKTQPNRHGAVKQEWMRQIKRAFTRAGIQPAYPRRALVHPSSTADSARTMPHNRSVA
jgi:small conductance mechanosensitive channel